MAKSFLKNRHVQIFGQDGNERKNLGIKKSLGKGIRDPDEYLDRTREASNTANVCSAGDHLAIRHFKIVIVSIIPYYSN